jgi:hypothetical protein
MQSPAHFRQPPVPSAPALPDWVRRVLGAAPPRQQPVEPPRMCRSDAKDPDQRVRETGEW